MTTQEWLRTVKLKKSNYVVQDIPSIRCSVIIWCRTSAMTNNQLFSNCVVQDLPSAVTNNQLLSNYLVQDILSIRCSLIIWCRTSTVTNNQLLSNCVVQDLPSAVTNNQLLSNYLVQDILSIRCSLITWWRTSTVTNNQPLSNYAVQQLPSALTEYQVCNNFPELEIYQADFNILQLDPSLTVFTQFTSWRFIYLRHFSTEFSKLYRVHIRALISLFQINTEESTHISLKQHFINTI